MIEKTKQEALPKGDALMERTQEIMDALDQLRSYYDTKTPEWQIFTQSINFIDAISADHTRLVEANDHARRDEAEAVREFIDGVARRMLRSSGMHFADALALEFGERYGEEA